MEEWGGPLPIATVPGTIITNKGWLSHRLFLGLFDSRDREQFFENKRILFITCRFFISQNISGFFTRSSSFLVGLHRPVVMLTIWLLALSKGVWTYCCLHASLVSIFSFWSFLRGCYSKEKEQQNACYLSLGVSWTKIPEYKTFDLDKII